MMISACEMKTELSEAEAESDAESVEDADLIAAGINEGVAAHLISAGPVGLAAAAAIATGRRRKRGYVFETNPAIRRRQQTRLLRRLRATIDEYCVRVGQQAVVVCCAPGKTKESFRTFGAKPLEDVIKNIRNVILQDLENALDQQAPSATNANPELFELPPLIIDGIPTPIDKMSQQQLRMFIPHMLKYSTGRGKPGWGRAELKPVWWPDDVPWKNIRIDERQESLKEKVSWTHALRVIVKNCYVYHGREDLLPTFDENQEPDITFSRGPCPPALHPPTIVQTVAHPDGTVSLVPVDADVVASEAGVALAKEGQVINVRSIEQIGDANEAMVTLHEDSNHRDPGDGRTLQRVYLEDDHMETEYGVEAIVDADGQIVITADGSAMTGNGDGVYDMVTIPLSRYHVMSAAGGNGPFRQVLQLSDRGKTTEQVIAVEENAHQVLDRRKRSQPTILNPANRSLLRHSEPQHITIEGTEGSFTILPAEKFELVAEEDVEGVVGSGAGCASVGPSFQVVEIAPGVQQLHVFNNNDVDSGRYDDDPGVKR